MKQKQEKGDLSPSIFLHTFRDKGSYVFYNANNENAIMVVTVKGRGESCKETNRYVQTATNYTLAEQGVIPKQRNDLVVDPDVVLINVVLGSFLITVLGGLILVGICIKGAWEIAMFVRRKTCRTKTLKLDLNHTDQTVFEKDNKFVQYKSTRIDSDSDDLDKVNLEIQQDAVEAGEQYLETFKRKKNKHKQKKRVRTNKVNEILLDIHDNIGQLSNLAINNNMRWLDLEGFQQDGEIDEAKIRAQIEAELTATEAREKKDDELYNEKKNELLKNSGEREKQVYEKSRQALRAEQTEASKDLNVNVGEKANSPAEMMTNLEYAIYDNYDPNSKHNQIVRKIQQDQNLTEEEKEFLMKSHEGNMHNIETIMDNEKKRQDQELDRALKDRVERRRRLKEKLNKN